MKNWPKLTFRKSSIKIEQIRDFQFCFQFLEVRAYGSLVLVKIFRIFKMERSHAGKSQIVSGSREDDIFVILIHHWAIHGKFLCF